MTGTEREREREREKQISLLFIEFLLVREFISLLAGVCWGAKLTQATREASIYAIHFTW
jgi:hypothetical protein